MGTSRVEPGSREASEEVITTIQLRGDAGLGPSKAVEGKEVIISWAYFGAGISRIC